MTYYCTKHIPLVRQLLGAALKNVAVEEGTSGMTSGSPPAYIALAHLSFESTAEFQKAFGPHTEQILSDIPNYTDIQPVLQISTVKI